MKKIVAIMLALVMSLGVLAACDETPLPSGGNEQTQPTDTNVPCTLSVTCGNGGTYSVSPTSDYHVGDEVTLTLSPYSGYRAGEVKVNGKALVLNGNECTFTLEGDSAAEISFDPIPSHSVTVNCGVGGSYTLSPNKSVYYEGDEITLTVTHRKNYIYGAVTLNEREVELTDEGTYTFTLTEDTDIDITFEEIVTHTVNISCGSGGTYSLSAAGPYADGQEVTLTVYPNADMNVKSVTVNGETVTLIKRAYTFQVVSDTAIVIAFEQKGAGETDTYGVFVTCGSEGSYTLSPEGPYPKGMEVTLTVTPQRGFYASSVTVDGTAVTLTEGKYTFTIEDDAEIVIRFDESLFEADLTGGWAPQASAGSLGYPLILKGESVLFSETEDEAKEYPVSDLGNGRYSFTVTDEENTKTVFTFSFLQIANGAKLLVLTFTEAGETIETYYLHDGIDYYTFSVPFVLVANWAPRKSGMGVPIEFTETGILYGGTPAIVLSYTAEAQEIVIPDGTLTYTQSSDLLTFTPADSDSKAVEYDREVQPGPVLIPFLEGSWDTLDGAHHVSVDEYGHFTYDGTQYELRPNDITGAMKSYYFTIPLLGRWDVDFYQRVVWVHQGYDEDKSYTLYSPDPFPVTIECGEGGSYTVLIEYNGETTNVEDPDGYEIGTTLTITFTANEGYVIDYIYEDVMGEMSRYSSTHGMKTFTVTFAVQQNWYDYHQNGRIAKGTFIPEESV